MVLKVSKYNSCKDFSFKRCSSCSSCSTENSRCSSILQEAHMMRSMPTTRDCELEEEIDINGDYLGNNYSQKEKRMCGLPARA